MRDPERIRYVTGNFERLQGMRWAPFALAFVLWGLMSAFVFEEPPSFFDFRPLRDGVYLLIAFAPWVFLGWIERYYDRRFGRVQQRRRKPSGYEPLVALGVLAAALIVGLPSVGERIGQPVSGLLAGLFLAGFVLAIWWPRRHRLAAHWPVLAVFGVGASLLPFAGVFVGERFPLLAVPFGLILMVGLLLDHLLLIRTLKAVPEEANGAES